MSASLSRSLSFDHAAQALDLDMQVYLFTHHPGEQSRRMTERIKLTAKLLTKAVGLQQSKALEAVAQALRFRTWHDLSSHLARGESAQPEALPKGWLDERSRKQFCFLRGLAVSIQTAMSSVHVPAQSCSPSTNWDVDSRLSMFCMHCR